MKNKNYKKANWIIGLAAVFLSIVLSGTNSFREMEWALYRWCANFTPAQPPSSELVLINIDAQSLKENGPWPWSRDIITAATRTIGKGRPAVIAYALSFEHAQNESALSTLDTFLEQNEKKLGKQLKAVNSLRWQINTDRTLAKTLKRYNTVLAMPYTPSPNETHTDETNTPLPAFLKRHQFNNVSAAGIPYLPSYFEIEQPIYIESLIAPTQSIAEASKHLGFFAASPVSDGGLSAIPLVLPYGNTHLASFELLVASKSTILRKKRLSIENHIVFGDKPISTDRWLRFYPNYAEDEDSPFTTISFNDVLNGKIPSSTFRNKTVLIGSNNALNGQQNNLHLHTSAQVISNLLQNNTVQLNSSSYFARLAAWAFIAFFLIAVLPRLRLNTGLSYTLTLLFAILIGELLAITLNKVWLPFAVPLLSLALGYFLQTINLSLQKQVKKFRNEISHTNTQLGQSYQAQGQLDLAYECYQKCNLNKDLLAYLYNLGLDYERKRQFNKAVKVFEYISDYKSNYKDVKQHIEKNKKHDKAIVLSPAKSKTHGDTLLLTDNDIENPMLGRYRIEKLIGHGAMGAVYLGSDPKISRTVAIKTMSVSSDDEKNISDFRKRFYREAETAGRLNHPNIVTVYDVGEEQDLAYIAMDYIKGNPLSDFTKPKKCLQPSEVIAILIQVSDALYYAHQNKVVHRDIKPANIIYNRRSKNCTITDFGVAHITDMSHTSTGTILGTPFYMSPEQLAGKKVDGRADIFAVGITLYELLCGERPFEGENLSALMYNITNKKHPDILTKNPDVPVCTKVIINKCLQKDVSKRYKDASQLMRALQNCQKQF